MAEQGENQNQTNEITEQWDRGKAEALPVPEPVTYDDEVTLVPDIYPPILQRIEREWKKAPGTLEAAVAETAPIVEEMGLTHDQIAGMAEGFKRSIPHDRNEAMYVDDAGNPAFAVTDVFRFMGRRPSPFNPAGSLGDPYDKISIDQMGFDLTNLSNGHKVAIGGEVAPYARHGYYADGPQQPIDLAVATGLYDPYGDEDAIVRLTRGDQSVDISGLDEDQQQRLRNLQVLGDPRVPAAA